MFLLGVCIFAVPSLRERTLTRLGLWKTKITYLLNPPEEELFIPLTPTSPLSNHTPTLPAPIKNATPTPVSPTPEPSPTPLPDKVLIPDVPYQTQKGFWNFCAPANLDMALRFWGWQGKPEEIGHFVKPFEKDKNVMPYELENFVQEKTEFHVITRYGGTIDLLRSFVAAGFPVLVEKGTYSHDISGKISWMGHYNLVIGYDDAQQQIIVHDSLLEPELSIPYEKFMHEWRCFNYEFQIVFPDYLQNDVFNRLEGYEDEHNSFQVAAEIASQEINSLTGNDLFFAWFNRGTSLQLLQDYSGASQAFDEAFLLLPGIPKNDRPWRIMWYQTGPYYAYYHTGRYQDVADLATNTINAASEPYLEESFYWRALAEHMLGNTADAQRDFCTSLKYHVDFSPTVYQMQTLGYGACP